MAREVNLYDLVAEIGAKQGIPLERLLVAALVAVADGRLSVQLPNAVPIDTLIHGNLSWRALIVGGARAVERRPNYYASWFRSIIVDAAELRAWARGSRQFRVQQSPGPKPTKRQSVANRMMEDLRSQRLARSELEAMLEKTMAERYRVSRDTCRKARNMVLSELPVIESQQ